jgi:hypothetical protein
LAEAEAKCPAPRLPFIQVWRQYWDYQIYKALEYQFVQGLECINKNLPEVEIKMVFRQHKLQYDPPLEEVRKLGRAGEGEGPQSQGKCARA